METSKPKVLLPNFLLNKSLDLLQYLESGIQDFHQLIQYLHLLPYQRISNPVNLNLILSEKRSTCSTKHAFIKGILDQHIENEISLTIGIFKMNNKNTPGIKNTLSDFKLSYIPEAHCYLKEGNQRYDFTFPDSDIETLIPDILSESTIQSHQIGQYKIELHKRYLQEWILSESISYTLDQIWSIREACIQQLTQTD